MAVNFNDSTPAAAAGGVNVKWQQDGSGNVSAYVVAGGASGVLKKTTNYNAAAGDAGYLVSFNDASAVSYTLLATPSSATWVVDVENIGAGVLTVNPNGANLDGSASSLILEQNQGCRIYTDGTNYFTQRGVGLGGNVNVQTASYNFAATDQGKAVIANKTSALTFTLLATPPSTSWYAVVKNMNVGVLTVARNGTTIDGKSSNLTLSQGDAVAIYTDGTNYYTAQPRPQSVGIFVPGTGSNNQVCLYLTMDRATIFPAGAPNSYANAVAAATGSTTYTYKKNGSSFATVLFSASGTTGAFTQASDAVFAPGDILELDGPATADATLANIGFTLQGYRF
jgi:hypothetical protein